MYPERQSALKPLQYDTENPVSKSTLVVEDDDEQPEDIIEEKMTKNLEMMKKCFLMNSLWRPQQAHMFCLKKNLMIS